MLAARAGSFEHAPLRSHVAVCDGSSLAVLAHCTAGDDGGYRERHRRDQDPRHPRRVFQMGLLGACGGRRRLELSLGGTAMALVGGLTLDLVVSTPRHSMWTAACTLEFAGPTFSIPMGGAPVALYAWHGTESLQARSDRAETGLIDRSSTNPVDARGRSAALEREGEEHGGSLWWHHLSCVGGSLCKRNMTELNSINIFTYHVLLQTVPSALALC